MKRLLIALLPAATLALAGCGGTSCSSSPATLQSGNPNPTCTLAAGTTATIDVTLCAKCTDTSPSCQAEFVSGQLEVAPVVQQCAEQAGCGIPGCATASPHATCTVTVPASLPAGTSGTLVVGGSSQVSGTYTIGSTTNCSL